MFTAAKTESLKPGPGLPVLESATAICLQSHALSCCLSGPMLSPLLCSEYFHAASVGCQDAFWKLTPSARAKITTAFPDPGY